MIRAILPILFGAAFTIATSLAMGYLLLRRLALAFSPLETALFSFLSGSACLSLAVFLLCLLHQARWAVFLALGIPAVAAALWQARRHPRSKPLPRPPLVWTILFSLVFTAYAAACFFNALAPEVSPDGSGYHLGNVLRYWRLQGFAWNYHSMYSYLSQGAEMLFLVAFSFGRHSAAALVHFAFLASLPLLVACYGSHFGHPGAGLFAAVAAFSSPVVVLAGSSAYNDLAVATLLFAVFFLLQVWDEIKTDNLLFLIGFLCGFAFAVKYTAALALPFAVAFVLVRDRRLRPAWAILAASGISIIPWMLRNWLWVGNPLAPFFNRWFPNPAFHPGPEQSYLADLRHYDSLNHYWEIPLQLTVHGKLTQGIIGPAFLLTLFGALALRSSHGRRLWLAALIFAVPAFLNTGARFLIPSLPFLALTIGFAFKNSWGVLPALALFEAVTCWPSVLSLYCDPVAWRLRDIPVRAALRLEPESQFLSQRVPDYPWKDAIEQHVPPQARIFSFSTRAEAYLGRDILVAYESAAGNAIQDLLETPLYHPPTVERRFSFDTQTAAALRIVQTAASPGDWALAEVRLWYQGREVPALSAWSLRAHPNPFEAPFAFDGNPVTRWSTWQPMEPGFYLEADFHSLLAFDEVLLEGFLDASQVRVEISPPGPAPRWISLAARPQIRRTLPPPGLRLSATSQVKARGIGFLLVNDPDSTAADMREHPSEWGLTRIVRIHDTTLYSID